MDSKQSELVEKYQNSILRRNHDGDRDGEESLSDEEILELLDEDDSFSKYRESRIKQLSNELKRINDSKDSSGENLGRITTYELEKELMEQVSKKDISIVHFYQPQFEKCKIMNQRLEILAEKHLSLSVMRIKAESAPFLSAKLNIKVLPLVLIYRKGRELTRLVGFEKLGNDPNNFSIEALENFMYINGIIQRRTINFGSIRSNRSKDADDDDDDLDL